MKYEFPQDASTEWTGLFRHLPRWIGPTNSIVDEPDNRSSLSFSKATFTSFSSSNFVSEVTRSLNPMVGVFASLSQECHNLAQTIDSVQNSLGIAFEEKGYAPVYIIPNAEKTSTIEVYTDEGWVTAEPLKCLFDALESIYFGWYYEDGQAILVNTGVVTGEIVTHNNWSYLEATDRHPYLPVTVETETGLFRLKPSQIKPDGRLPLRNVERCYYYLYADYPDAIVRVNGVEHTLSAFDVTDETDYISLLYSVPYSDLDVSIRRNTDLARYYQHQNLASVEVALSIAFDQYSKQDLQFGDVNDSRYFFPEPELDVIITGNEGRSIIDHKIDSLGLTAYNRWTSDFTDPTVRFWRYLRSRFSGETYEYRDISVISPGVTIENVDNYDVKPKWNPDPINNLSSSSFV